MFFMEKIKADNLAAAIAKELEGYRDGVAQRLQKEIRAAARECREDIREASPRATGEYAEGWMVSKIYQNREGIRLTVHNRKKPQLTHLLENGHAKAGGGRVAARPHVAPAEKKLEKRLEGKAKVIVHG